MQSSNTRRAIGVGAPVVCQLLSSMVLQCAGKAWFVFPGKFLFIHSVETLKDKEGFLFVYNWCMKIELLWSVLQHSFCCNFFIHMLCQHGTWYCYNIS